MQTNASSMVLMENTMPPSKEIHAPSSHHPHHFFICIEELHTRGIQLPLHDYHRIGRSHSYKHVFSPPPVPKGKHSAWPHRWSWISHSSLEACPLVDLTMP